MLNLFKKNHVDTITPEDAKEQMLQDPTVVLLDVRTCAEFHALRIPGSINVSVEQISHIENTIPNKESKVFVYCLSGHRSAMACAAMKEKGYPNIFNLGGITQWPFETEGDTLSE